MMKNVCTTFNKLTSVFYASVLLLMINCVITLSKWLWNHEPQWFRSGSADCSAVVPQASGSQSGQVLQINVGKRLRKLAVNFAVKKAK